MTPSPDLLEQVTKVDDLRFSACRALEKVAAADPAAAKHVLNAIASLEAAGQQLRLKAEAAFS